MAAMGYPKISFFALKGQQMVEKGNYDNNFLVLSIENVQIILLTLFKCSDPISKMAAIVFHAMTLCRKMATDSQKDNFF